MNTTCLIRKPRRQTDPLQGLTLGQGSSRFTARPSDFKTRFCNHFGCPAEQYQEVLFKRFLHRHAVPVAGFLARWNPDFFREDYGLIRDLENAASHSEVLTELNRFYGRNVRERNWLRRRLSLRISGKRILRLSRALFQGSGHN